MRLVQFFVAVMAVAIIVLTASGPSIQAKAINDSVAFQGRLTDLSDNAVPDGPRDLTLSLWTDSVGGTMVFSEVRTVTVSKGLYSTCLGCGSAAFMDAMENGDLWLQTQLAGQAPMSPRTRIRGVPRAMYSSGLYGEATSGSAKARGIITTKPNLTGPVSAIILDADVDGDGHPEYYITDSVSTGSASRRTASDTDEDGSPDGEITNGVTPTTSSVAINQKGTGADKGRTSSLSSGGAFDSMGVSINTDSDGDGLSDATVSQSTSATGSQLTLKTANNSMPNRISMNMTVGRQTPNTSFGERCDMNGDGNPETQFEQLCTPDSVVQTASMGHGGGGGGGGQASYNMRTRIDQLEQRLQNIGLLNTTSIRQTSDDTSGMLVASVDKGNNGTSNSSATMAAKEKRSELNIKFQDGDIPNQSDFSVVQDTSGSHGTWVKTDGGAMNISLSVDAEETRNQLKQYFQRGDKPTQGQFSSLLDAAGVHAGWSNSDGGTTSIGASIDAIETRSILKQYFERGDVPTQSQFTTLLDGTGARSDWSSTTSGATTTLSIVADEGADPITHSSGAKLTAGGVWTNASDENLKENFRPVDGQEMLEKIDELPIRQWNYKNEADSVTHIGPTAQDFKGLFGVGDNDKTISTIDPSGVALAGIKELHKENLALKAQNAELKKQLDELKQMVEKLVSTK